MPLKDLEARRAYMKRYYEANAEKIKERSAAWYADHKHEPEFRERADAYTARWRAENRERYLAWLRARHRAEMADPIKAERARAAYRKGWRRRTAVLVAIANEAKIGGCLQCKESSRDCLDFHHRDPSEKAFTIGKAIQRNVKPEVLRAEIAKCDVLCANCHLKHEAAIRPGWRKQTPSESSRDAARRAEKEDRWKPLIARAHADGCTTCAEKDPACLVFHHVDPGRKDFMVMAYRLRVLRGPIVEEMMKCVVLCQNCHRRVHVGSLALPPFDLDAYWLERLAY